MNNNDNGINTFGCTTDSVICHSLWTSFAFTQILCIALVGVQAIYVLVLFFFVLLFTFRFCGTQNQYSVTEIGIVNTQRKNSTAQIECSTLLKMKNVYELCCQSRKRNKKKTKHKKELNGIFIIDRNEFNDGRFRLNADRRLKNGPFLRRERIYNRN